MKIYAERPPCVLGVVVRGKRLSYCVLEPPDSLLDWGVKDFPDRRMETIEKLLGHIFDFYRPEYLVIEDVMNSTCRLSGRNIQVVKKIEKMSEGKFISVRNISWSETKVSLCLNTTAKFMLSQNLLAINNFPY